MMARGWQLADRLDAMTLRERALVFAAALAIVFGIWVNFVLDPIEARSEAMDHQSDALRQQLDQLKERSQLLGQRLSTNPNRALAREKERLQAKADDLDVRLRKRTGAYVGPEQMASLLQDLLDDRQGLQLISLKNTVPERVSLQGADEQAMPRIYRHGVELEFEGDFSDVVGYLKAIKALPWRFLWTRLDYQVTDYPRARIRLRLETLSAQEGWIGA